MENCLFEKAAILDRSTLTSGFQFEKNAQDFTSATMSPKYYQHQLRFGADESANASLNCCSAASCEEIARISFSHDMAYSRRLSFNTWRAHLIGYGNDEQQLCYHSQISFEQLCQTTPKNSGELLLLGAVVDHF